MGWFEAGVHPLPCLCALPGSAWGSPKASVRRAQPEGLSHVQKKDPDQVQLWGLQEGTYLFQLTVPGPEQPDSTSNITITVLSAKQTEGEGGGEATAGASLVF